MLRVGSRRLVVAAILCLCFGAVAVRAMDFPPIREFQHTAWTAREGAPSVASCFAQTEDGYLWIGSPLGLYRFDGVQFDKIQSLNGARLRDGKISTLFTDREGGLWIGYDQGMSRYVHNRLFNFGETEGFPANTYVLHFAQDKHGRMWAATQAGLYRRGSDGHWLRIGAETGYDEPMAQEVAVDDEGTVWVLSSQNLYYLAEGAARFQKAAPQIGGFGFVYRRGGFIWTSRRERPLRGGLRQFPYLNGSVIGRDTPGYVLDQSGGLWLENTGDGIYRVSNAARLLAGGLGADRRGVEAFTSREGLSGDTVLSMFEDREHNVWVGTDNGLDRFTPSSFFSVSIPVGSNRLSLARGNHGSVIVASFHDKALIIAPDGTIKGNIPIGGTLGATFRDVDDTLWLSSEHGILHLTGQGRETIPLPDFHVRRQFDQVIAMTKDRHGALWVSIQGKGVFQFSDHSWRRIETGFVSAGTAALCTFTDANGTVWLGYPNNLIVAVGLPGRDTYTRFDAPDLGNVKFLAESHGALWAGGDMGVSVSNGHQFRRVELADHEELTGLSGMIFAHDGDLFLTEQSRVLRVPRAELQRVLNAERPVAEYQAFDFDSPPADLIPISRSVVASDGRLWFISSKGLAWLDSSQAWAIRQPPLVLVKSLTTQNKSFRVEPGLTFPPRTKSVQFTYTATTLTSSEKVHFRYRLEGSDTGWQDAGTRREAFYTNLAPGNYVFHVIANNGGDNWSDPGAVFPFRIAPAFNQTVWFYLICATLFCGLIYLAYLVRIRRFVALYELRNAERVAERERIARELHDTLLQGVHGLILRFSVLTTNYPEGDLTRAALDDTLVRAEKMLIEGRQRVRNLRVETNPIDLPEALSEAGHEMTAGAIRFEMTVRGTRQLLRRPVSEEMFNIGREAMNNSVLHARCTKIEVELIYSRSFLVLRVRDDGDGFDPSAFASKQMMDHWGIPGMKERSAALGGELNIYSKPGFGTEVELCVPARLAFRKSAPAGRFRRIWGKARRIIAKGRIVPRGSGSETASSD